MVALVFHETSKLAAALRGQNDGKH